MKSITRKTMALVIALSLSAFCFGSMASAAKLDNSRTMIKQKLDLSSGGVSATKTGAAGGMDQVNIKAVVRAMTASPGKVCSGPFKVKIEKDTAGAWVFLGHAGVANLCASKILRKVPTATVNFSDNVPSNLAGAQKYRIVIDYMDVVDEMNETNNIDGTRYIP